MSIEVICVVAAICLVAVSSGLSVYFMSRSIDKSFAALREDRRWLSERFLEILEPRFIEHRQRLDAIDEEIQMQENEMARY